MNISCMPGWIKTIGRHVCLTSTGLQFFVPPTLPTDLHLLVIVNYSNQLIRLLINDLLNNYCMSIIITNYQIIIVILFIIMYIICVLLCKLWGIYYKHNTYNSQYVQLGIFYVSFIFMYNT